MKLSSAVVGLVALLASSSNYNEVSAFAPAARGSFGTSTKLASTTSPAGETTMSGASDTKDPLLIRAARGEDVERTPVWMMRQAGRHIAEYRDLCKKYPTFRQRSEIPEVAVEVSLQPWRNYDTDGCILFSDILTPFPGMGCEFTIDEKVGPLMAEPIANWDDLKKMHAIDPEAATPFVAEALETLRKEVGPETAVLGFVGCPYTLATYLVEGQTSRTYLKTKTMMLNEPKLLHAILSKLAENIAQYALFQIAHGAQLIQIFDSWAGELSPYDYDTFAAPYQTVILDAIKAKHPEIPTVIYIKHSGALIERMAGTGADIVSLDWTVDMAEGRERVANGRKAAGHAGRGGVQGNLDPVILFADHAAIKERTEQILEKAGPTGHVMNLGHGIEASTPEENAHFFIETVRNYKHKKE
eukprot:CAMPEP_0198291720 /NCGR_PEP_ID=MMETSP1449-20131203/9159_1 /TAXON_ID=420275 /ORGANISM="Attheya septentrionalis, Strain CCMP2084" /LENGTH=413 /DNA_ID=CAMNT_0043990399 /DNA_START=51 /DNA_END=1292 /DNA_ORIENTATION=-